MQSCVGTRDDTVSEAWLFQLSVLAGGGCVGVPLPRPSNSSMSLVLSFDHDDRGVVGVVAVAALFFNLFVFVVEQAFVIA